MYAPVFLDLQCFTSRIEFVRILEGGKDSKWILMVYWSLFKSGTNHPSIAYRAVSCSKVDVEESVSRTN